MLQVPLVVAGVLAYAGGDVLDMVIRAATVSKAILFILFAFSVASWAIILERWWFFRKAEARSATFLRNFRRSDSVSAFRRAVIGVRDNPFARIFERAWTHLEENGQARSGNPGPLLDQRTTPALESLRRTLEQAASDELAGMERNLGFLATTGSTCPFIGLLGTVWGVMSAFMSMGREGSASLTVVAPGIAEALIVTAAGLFAAIPAVIGYNLFVTRAQRFGRRMDSFSLELLNALERERS